MAAGLAACSGDSTTTDGGTDATTDVGPKTDSGGTDSGGTDGGGTDGGGTDGGGTDGGGTDGATDATTGDGGSFACGTQTCSSATQYCTKTTVGPDGGLPDAAQLPDASKLDGGQVEIDTCTNYPTTCTADGGTPSCTCVQGSCSGCTESNGDITVTCP